jgi:hypothetical protein
VADALKLDNRIASNVLRGLVKREQVVQQSRGRFGFTESFTSPVHIGPWPGSIGTTQHNDNDDDADDDNTPNVGRAITSSEVNDSVNSQPCDYDGCGRQGIAYFHEVGAWRCLEHNPIRTGEIAPEPDA